MNVFYIVHETLEYNPDVKCSHHEHNHGEGQGCGSHCCHLVEEKKLKRPVATIITTLLITFIGSFNTLSFGPLRDIKIFGMSIFDACDYLCSNILLPLGGILICIFAGWYLDKAILYNELSNNGRLKIHFFKLYTFILKYIAPVCIFLILLNVLGILK